MHFYAFRGNIKSYIDRVKFAAPILNKKLNLPDNSGTTPMHIAAELGHIEFVKILLPYWNNCGLLNSDNKTAYDIAKEKGHQEIMTLMVEKQTALLNISCKS